MRFNFVRWTGVSKDGFGYYNMACYSIHTPIAGIAGPIHTVEGVKLDTN